jgi:hypothetical protein
MEGGKVEIVSAMGVRAVARKVSFFFSAESIPNPKKRTLPAAGAELLAQLFERLVV